MTPIVPDTGLRSPIYNVIATSMQRVMCITDDQQP